MGRLGEGDAEGEADRLGPVVTRAIPQAWEPAAGPIPETVLQPAGDVLATPFPPLRIDIGRSLHRTSPRPNAIAATDGGRVSIRESWFREALPSWRRALVGHEIVHAAQQATCRAAGARFAHDCPGSNTSPEATWANDHDGFVFRNEVGESGTRGRIVSNVNELILWNFCVGDSGLRPQHQAELRAAARRWRPLLAGQSPQGLQGTAPSRPMRLKIIGSASQSGDSSANRQLARARADAVKAFLTAGVPAADQLPASSVDPTDVGTSQPITDEAAASQTRRVENMARNRRVTITVFVPTQQDEALAIGGTTVDPDPPRLNLALRSERTSDSINHRLLQAVRAKATVRGVPAGVDVGFIQFLTRDVRRVTYRPGVGGTDPRRLRLDYHHCVGQFTPCRDVLDAAMGFSFDRLTGALKIVHGPTAAGTTEFLDSPGFGMDRHYRDATGSTWDPELGQWEMDFILAIAARSGSSMRPLRFTSWGLRATFEVHSDLVVLARTTVHGSGGWASGGAPGINLEGAMSGITCRLATRTMGADVCRPFETISRG